VTMIPEPFDLAPSARDDDEGLFSRDVNGQLVRLDAPTESDYGETVSLQIDGRPVVVPLAEPLKDSQGNIVLDADGRTTPRYTTIYDAAVELYVRQPGDEAKIPVPTLCHQPHMNPVAVCRLCVVQIYGQKRGKRAPERKLLPACQHQVKDGMEVFTMNDPGDDGKRVRQSVKVLTELLASDHLKDAPEPAPAAELKPFNELQQMVDRVGLTDFRFRSAFLKDVGPHAPVVMRPPIDASSPVFLVDHSACILCDRCSRACDDVKKNEVIGRTGKGLHAGIAFDLDDPMGDSSCVQCGECMVSCPTSAITFKPVAKVKPKGGGSADTLAAADLIRDPLFSGVPPKFLLWQEGLAIRRFVKAGEVLCRQGEPGNTAFMIRSGRVVVTSGGAAPSLKGGLLKIIGNRDRSGIAAMPAFRTERGPEHLIVGEMACLSGTPRTADVTAIQDSEIWEIRRNVLDRLMRSPSQRDRFEQIYRERALDVVLRNSDVFKGVPPQEYQGCIDFLRPKLTFLRVEPGQTLFSQGDWADNLYLVRLGHVCVSFNRDIGEAGMRYRGPGTVLGEIGLLAISPEDAAADPNDVGKLVDSLDRKLGEALAESTDLAAALPAGRRTATCTSLDHLELARVTRADFLEMVRRFPLLRRNLVRMAVERVTGDRDHRPAMRDYIAQGLYQAQNLLALDLTKCTRCDECTKACVSQHGNKSHGVPVTRLLREGLEFGNFLVATSCRSCKDAYCMIGCPVDSIHRGKHQQIVIEDHCIGCGLCATNCPFGNIWMPENESHRLEAADSDRPGHMRMVAQPKAATCDLCDAEGKRDQPLPRCVHACPHDAAHRMTGEELLDKVTRAMTEPH
jgi:Fe-S-cluster-containing hydrogenase component 2